jgi:probable Rubsico expression protein CbbX
MARPGGPAPGVPGTPGVPATEVPAPHSPGSDSPPAGAGSADPPLPPDARVDLAAERRRSGIDEILSTLDAELVGLVQVKQRVRELAALLLVDRVRGRFGLTATRPTLHMSFTGTGTGKTTVATRMAQLLHRLGCVPREHLVVASREDLVGQYVGHTAPRTKEVLGRAMGGVLFIDEAYHLFRPGNERDYGQEAIEILLQVMENRRDELVVILAGYGDRMDTFFSANPGMASRISHHLEFPDYPVDELLAVAGLLLERENYYLAPDATTVLRDYLTRRRAQPRFANARSVRNAVERARLRHATRLLAGPTGGRDDLMRLEAADFLASRVFAAGVSPPAADRTATPAPARPGR